MLRALTRGLPLKPLLLTMAATGLLGYASKAWADHLETLQLQVANAEAYAAERIAQVNSVADFAEMPTQYSPPMDSEGFVEPLRGVPDVGDDA